MLTRWPVPFAFLGLVCGGLLGCGHGEPGAAYPRQPASEAFAPPGEDDAPALARAVAPATAVANGPPEATKNRKIIYNTSLQLIVEDYQDFESRIVQLVDQHGGFVSNAETNRRYSDRQSGTWRIRVPVDQYAAFLTGVTGLGFAESRVENAQDVSEEFVDIEARIKNKRELERRIITMLEERTGKLADVLEIERELSRIREEIERMEGRLRYLSDRTTLATITIECREERRYTPDEAPTFASRIGRSWWGSLEALIKTGENLLIAFVATVPWLVAFGLPLALGGAALRFRRP